jgi:hypothetical protein
MGLMIQSQDAQVSGRMGGHNRVMVSWWRPKRTIGVSEIIYAVHKKKRTYADKLCQTKNGTFGGGPVGARSSEEGNAK